MRSFHAKIEDIISGKVGSPFPAEMIPDEMGINLRNVEAATWQTTDDDQLVSLTIHFIPE